MPQNDPLQSALDAADKLRAGLIPAIRDRFAAKVPRRPHVSLNRLASMPDADAATVLSQAVAKHGEAAVTQELRRQSKRGKT